MKRIGKEEPLCETVGIRCGILSIVGAGGKTTSVFKIAREQEAMGKKVLVTTTTHMELPGSVTPSLPTEGILYQAMLLQLSA